MATIFTAIHKIKKPSRKSHNKCWGKRTCYIQRTKLCLAREYEREIHEQGINNQRSKKIEKRIPLRQRISSKLMFKGIDTEKAHMH